MLDTKCHAVTDVSISGWFPLTRSGRIETSFLLLLPVEFFDLLSDLLAKDGKKEEEEVEKSKFGKRERV